MNNYENIMFLSKVLENCQSPFELSCFDARLSDVVNFCEEFAILPCCHALESQDDLKRIIAEAACFETVEFLP